MIQPDSEASRGPAAKGAAPDIAHAATDPAHQIPLPDDPKRKIAHTMPFDLRVELMAAELPLEKPERLFQMDAVKSGRLGSDERAAKESGPGAPRAQAPSGAAAVRQSAVAAAPDPRMLPTVITKGRSIPDASEPRRRAIRAVVGATLVVAVALLIVAFSLPRRNGLELTSPVANDELPSVEAPLAPSTVSESIRSSKPSLTAPSTGSVAASTASTPSPSSSPRADAASESSRAVAAPQSARREPAAAKLSGSSRSSSRPGLSKSSSSDSSGSSGSSTPSTPSNRSLPPSLSTSSPPVDSGPFGPPIVPPKG